ncbi:MAG: YraN family protein [Armatimonadota bacterium]
MRRIPLSPDLPRKLWQWLDGTLFGGAETAAKTKLQVGYDAEDLATSYLKAKGYLIVERNLRVGKGELDIVAEHDGTLVIVEVKSGKQNDAYLPRERVDRAKQQQLLKLTEAYRKQRRILAQSVRVDVVEVVFESDGRPQIEHFMAAVEERRR